MTTFKIFTEPSSGYGVRAERNGELPQVILPTRTTSISGESLPKVDGASVTLVRNHTQDQATRVLEWAQKQDDRNISELRLVAEGIAK